VKHEVVIAGFGGQGVLFAGHVLAHAALEAGLHTTWYPSYGPEMRGGTANCVVTVSDEPIGAPIVRSPAAAIVMNLPSLERFEPLVRPRGVLIVNASLVDRGTSRRDLEVVRVRADDEAHALGSPKLANMVLLGALLARLELVTLDVAIAAAEAVLSDRHRQLAAANAAALRRGAAIAAAPEDRPQPVA
jgi:2-oxoglutarate ferredoxin oxidoreductase subunit gamma